MVGSSSNIELRSSFFSGSMIAALRAVWFVAQAEARRLFAGGANDCQARIEGRAHIKTRTVWWFALLSTLLLAGCQGNDTQASNQASLWTVQHGTVANDYGFGVATDTSDNVYVAGRTYGSLDGNTSAGSDDAFVIKYDGSGVKQWTRQFGTAGADHAFAVATDASGNVYVAGDTNDNLDGNTSAGLDDLFVVKYDSSGVKQWARQLGTASYEYALGVATDTIGNVFVAGYTGGDLDGNTSAGGYDLFVIKYDSSGVKQWTRQLGTTAGDFVSAVATDASGSVYVVGETYGDLDGNISAGGDDLFVVKYDSSGVKQWTRQLGSAMEEHAYGVAADTSGNVYIAGHTAGDLDGNAGAGLDDLFVAKYDSSGVKQWTRQLGSAMEDFASAVAVDASGNVYVSGFTNGDLDGNTSAGGYDLFLIKYDSTGVKQWARQHGTVMDDFASGISINASGNIFLSGETYGSLDGNTNAGGLDMFVVKYAADGTLQ